MYLEYVKEREGLDYLENEDGFVIYEIMDSEKTIYIKDIYVKPEKRKTYAATRLADRAADLAKVKGMTHLLGSVCPLAKGATESLKVLLGYGMKLFKIENGLIWFFKEI